MADGSNLEGFGNGPDNPKQEPRKDPVDVFDDSVLSVPEPANQNEAPTVSTESIETEIGIEQPEEREMILEAGENNALYTLEVTYNYDIGKFTRSNAYQNLETLQQTLSLIEAKVAVDEQLSDTDIEAVQAAYNKTKRREDIWTPEETARIKSAVVAEGQDIKQELALEQQLQAEAEAWCAKKAVEGMSPEMEQLEDPESTTKPEGFLQKELNQISSELEAADTEAVGLIGQIFEQYQSESERPERVRLYLNQLSEIQTNLNALDEALNATSEQTTIERELVQFINKNRAFIDETNKALHAIAVAIEMPLQDWDNMASAQESIDTDPVVKPHAESVEAVDETQRLESLKEKMFRKVDGASGLTHTERAAAHELFNTYLGLCEETSQATQEDKDAAAGKLENFLTLLGKNAPTAEYISHEIERVMAAIEEVHLSDTKLMTEAVRIHADLEALLAQRPQEFNPVDQLIAEKSWQNQITGLLEQLRVIQTKSTETVEPVPGYHPVQVNEDQSPVEISKQKPVNLKRRLFDFTGHSDDVDLVTAVPIDISRSTNPDSLEWLMKLHGKEVGRDIYESRLVQRNLRDKADELTRRGESDESNAMTDDPSEHDSPIVRADLWTPKKESMTGRTDHPEKRNEKSRDEKVWDRITDIESKAFGWLDRRIGDVQSPVNQLADTNFRQFENLVSMSKRDFITFTENEYRGMNLKYEAFQQWAPYLKSLVEYAETLPRNKRTTQKTVEGFVAQNWNL